MESLQRRGDVSAAIWYRLHLFQLSLQKYQCRENWSRTHWARSWSKTSDPLDWKGKDILNIYIFGNRINKHELEEHHFIFHTDWVWCIESIREKVKRSRCKSCSTKLSSRVEVKSGSMLERPVYPYFTTGFESEFKFGNNAIVLLWNCQRICLEICYKGRTQIYQISYNNKSNYII